MQTDYQASALFLENYHAQNHIVINQGGTSSGKTQAIRQVFCATN
jgi:phage terminase large subunit